MVQQLYVASRKGLLTYDLAGDDCRLIRTDFQGDPVSAVLRDPRDNALYAGLDLGHFGIKFRRSEDDGANWEELPPPAFPDSGDEDAEGPSVELIWTLVAGGEDRPGELWAGTIPGGLFHSDDRGESWQLVESLWNRPEREKWMGGGMDRPGIHSISIHPGDSARMALGVSTGGVWLTEDHGEIWTLGGEGLRAEYAPPESAHDPLFQDVHRLARCRAQPDRIWCQHHNGIFVSSDGGAHFTEIEEAEPSVFGFAVVAHPEAPDTAWFAPAIKDEYRLPVDNRFVVSRTRDGGASFELLTGGLPSETSFDLVYRHALAADGCAERLAMGTTTGNLWIGEEGGERWRLVSNYLPPINQVLFSDGDA